MKSKTLMLLMVVLLGTTINLHAQTDSLAVADFLMKPNTINEAPKTQKASKRLIQIPSMNLIKLNLTSLLLKSYSLQYERVLNRKFSIAIQYRMMPETGIPFKNNVLKLVDDEDADTRKTIEDFKISNYAITPEVRIYLSRKGFGKGFYLAPFYRYASFTSNQLNVFFTDENDMDQSVKMSGKITSNTFGLSIGAQHFIGKHIVLDWSMFGPHYGSAKGNFSGTPSHSLSGDEQNDLRDQLDGIDIPLTTKTVNVSANQASLNLDGPWAGLRFTIGLGVKF